MCMVKPTVASVGFARFSGSHCADPALPPSALSGSGVHHSPNAEWSVCSFDSLGDHLWSGVESL